MGQTLFGCRHELSSPLGLAGPPLSEGQGLLSRGRGLPLRSSSRDGGIPQPDDLALGGRTGLVVALAQPLLGCLLDGEGGRGPLGRLLGFGLGLPARPVGIVGPLFCSAGPCGQLCHLAANLGYGASLARGLPLSRDLGLPGLSQLLVRPPPLLLGRTGSFLGSQPQGLLRSQLGFGPFGTGRSFTVGRSGRLGLLSDLSQGAPCVGELLLDPCQFFLVVTNLARGLLMRGVGAFGLPTGDGRRLASQGQLPGSGAPSALLGLPGPLFGGLLVLGQLVCAALAGGGLAGELVGPTLCIF